MKTKRYKKYQILLNEENFILDNRIRYKVVSSNNQKIPVGNRIDFEAEVFEKEYLGDDDTHTNFIVFTEPHKESSFYGLPALNDVYYFERESDVRKFFEGIVIEIDTVFGREKHDKLAEELVEVDTLYGFNK